MSAETVQTGATCQALRCWALSPPARTTRSAPRARSSYGNAVIGQSGGPTAVINQSLAGVIEGLQGRSRRLGPGEAHFRHAPRRARAGEGRRRRARRSHEHRQGEARSDRAHAVGRARLDPRQARRGLLRQDPRRRRARTTSAISSISAATTRPTPAASSARRRQKPATSSTASTCRRRSTTISSRTTTRRASRRPRATWRSR